jgi:hypothetical protein
MTPRSQAKATAVAHVGATVSVVQGAPISLDDLGISVAVKTVKDIQRSKPITAATNSTHSNGKINPGETE